jgi:hypothetical protein
VRIQEQLDEGLARRTVEAAQEAAESVNHAYDLKGKPRSGSVILDMMEQMELSFAADGTWIPPGFMAHPDTAPKVDAALAEIDNDPSLQARRAAIVNLDSRTTC